MKRSADKRNNAAKQLRSKDGFTTVELIVVIVILMILSGFVATGLVKWIEWSNFKQENERARSIFVAAQNQLNEYAGSNRLGELQEVLLADGKDTNVVPMDRLTDAEGNHYDDLEEVLNKVWPESADKAPYASKYREEICYLMGTARDYRDYLAGTSNAQVTALYDLLSSYLYDTSILNAAICIEFTPGDGQVFSVLYSSRQDAFSYTDEAGKVNISNRTADYRRSRMTGYYGVDTLYTATTTKPEKPSISGVKLNNEETLNLTFYLSRIPEATQELTYQIAVRDKNSDDSRMVISLDGTKLKNRPTEILCSVSREDGVSTGQTDYGIIAWVDSQNTVHVVLDAADLSASAETYYQAYIGLRGGMAADQGAVEAFRNTQSFHRFGIDTEDIVCVVGGKGTFYKDTAQKKSNDQNTYFGSCKKAEDESVSYTILNARHLYNLRYVEDYTEEQRQGDYQSLLTKAVSYELKNDMDWRAFIEGGFLYRSVSGKSWAAGSRELGEDMVADPSAAFPSFRQLRSTSVLTGGRNRASVSGLTITREENESAGVYSGAAYHPTDQDSQPTGMFVTNYGTIQNMSLDRITVEGINKTGAYCGRNAGTLARLSVEDSGRSAGLASVVSGGQDVGGIAGYQMGTEDYGESDQTAVTYEELTNRAKVTGTKYVGGIVGRLTAEANRAVMVEGCVNYGRVEAEAYEGRRDDNKALQSSYIGGIAGYCYNKAAESGQEKAGQLTLSNCISSPQYTSQEIEALIRDPESLEKKLNGLFVGGIVGYSENSTITGCSTVNEKNQPGYLFGMLYVGGIAGFIEGPEGSVLNGGTGSEEYGVNESNVIGGMYAGGIVGANADGFYDSFTSDKKKVNHKDVLYPGDYLMTIRPNDEFSMNMKVTNWLNKGAVFAAGSYNQYVPQDGYAGGITGYNAGWVYHCNSEVEGSQNFEELAASGAFNSRLVGGIAGCNYGIIGNTQRDDHGEIIQGSGGLTEEQRRLYTVCHVYGNSIVGGIVGYNAVDAIVEDFAVAGGYVRATGSYAGGYAGVNASKYLLMKESGEGRIIHSNPNEVSGAYCVGGIIGGNIIALKDDETVSAVFKADNFLGKLEASAFAGGYIGFNATINVVAQGEAESSSSAATDITILNKLYATLKYYDEYFHPGNSDQETPGEKESRLNSILEVARSWHTSDVKDTEGTLHIAGNQEDVPEEESASQLGGINGEIYVAGVVGYNDDDSSLKISNVVNMTPVRASFAIENETEHAGKTYLNQNFTYSYAGGIIGKAGKKVTVENCRNQGVGDVATVGTYTGGLCEINEGMIRNCQVSSVGEISTDYIGGIAGLNKSGGTIEGCTFSGKTITGRNYVGGIAAENYGTIEAPLLGGAAINSYGSQEQGYTGGVTGWNYSSGSISLSGGTGLLVAITSNGSNAGGVAGRNEGSIQITGSRDGSSVVSIEGSVTGYQNVGGLVGINSKNTNKIGFKGYVNAAAVTASYGAAGGIAGLNQDQDTVFDSCTNTGEITAPNGGNAGGILGENKGVIRYCNDNGRVLAPNGICGGIVGINDGLIQSSQVYSKQAERLKLTGSLYVGGICGVNTGMIAGGSVRAIELHNLSGSTGGSMGGAAGENRGEYSRIENVSVGTETAETGSLSSADKVDEEKNRDMLVMVSFASDVDMGGVAGRNSGTVTGGKSLLVGVEYREYTPVYASLSFYETSMSYYGNLGGITGTNTGAVSGYEFNGTVAGTANNPQNSPEYNPNTDYETSGAVIYGYGGITGVNGSSSAAANSSVSRCKVNIASVTGLGDANNIANIGGIAGVNSLGAVISDVSYGTSAVYKLKNTSNAVSAVKDANSKPTGSVFVGTSGKNTDYAHAGGVAGMNSGRISTVGMEFKKDEDGQEEWQVTDGMDASCVLVENYRGHVGGITGYNRRTGIVEKAATGKKWIIFAPQNAQDNGCGGIVGYSASENGLQYCTNKAVVVKLAQNSNGVGGMVGRLECATTTNWSIHGCINYGEIYGARRVGGMIGVWKYYGGTVSDCVNYGKVTLTDGEGAGGIVGNFYSLSSTPAYIARCENHGMINAQGKNGGAGIAGLHAGTTAWVQIEHCVNTGVVAGNNSAGILNSQCSVNSSSYIKYCTNYGYVTGKNGIVGKGGTNDKLLVQNSLGVAGLDYPVSDERGNDSDNYYISSDASSQDDIELFGVEQIEASDNIASESVKYLGQLVEVGSYTNNAFFRNSTGTGNWEYIFTFNQPLKLSDIHLYWNRSNLNRVTNYSVWGREKEQDDWKLISSQANFDISSVTAQDLAAFSDPEEVVIPEENSDLMAKQVKIVITNCVQLKSNKKEIDKTATVCLLKFQANGYVKGGDGKYIDFDGTKGKCLALMDGAADYVKYPAGSKVTSKNAVTFDLDALRQSLGGQGDTSEEKGRGIPLRVADDQEGGYRLVRKTSSGEVNMGLPGFLKNPVVLAGSANGFQKDNSLKAVGGSADNIRYQVFEADHDYFDLTGDAGVAKLQFTSETIRFTNGDNASYIASWQAVPNASYYEYRISYYGRGSEIPLRVSGDIVYAPSVEIPVSAVNGTKVEKIQVEVRAGTKSYIAGKVQEIWTEKWISETQDVGDILPTPRFHFELAYHSKAKNLQYLCYLDNQEEYREFLSGQGIPENDLERALKDIEITVTGKNWTGKITANQTVAAQNGSYFYYGGENSNFIYSAVAKSKGTGQAALQYVTSQNVLRESQAYNDSFLRGDIKIANVVQDGFYGKTVDSLSYQVKVGATSVGNGKIFYMRNELSAVPAKLGVPVSLSSAQVRVSDTTLDNIAVLLSRLPEDILDQEDYSNIMVRSYPAVISNNVVYMGHSVDLEEVRDKYRETGIGVSAETLQELYVTEDNQVSWTWSSTKLIQEKGDESSLAPGFVIELASDGSYTLYYNTLLYYNDLDETFEYGQEGMKTQVFYKRLDDKWNKMPEPVVHVNYDKGLQADGDVNQDNLEITWDLKDYENVSGTSNYMANAEYDYTIIGYSADSEGNSISSQVAAGYYVTGKDGENILTFDTAAWAFNRVEVTISRRGETDQNGRTTAYPSYTSSSYPMKARFSQISRPVVSLAEDGSGSAAKDSLLYQVVWNPVSDSERYSAVMDEEGQITGKQDNLDHYEVEVRRSENDTAAGLAYDSEEEYTAAWDRLKTIYENRVTVYGGTAQVTEYGLLFEWSQEQQGVTVHKSMELTGNKKDLTVIGELVLKWQCSADADRQIVDLNDYERNEILDISVSAAAREDTDHIVIPYRDSLEGVARELTLPSRLYVPDVEQLTGMWEYRPESYVTMDSFLKQGVRLQFAGTSGAQVQQKYELAAAVYPHAPGDPYEYDQAEAGDAGTGRWNEGAVRTLLRKSDGVVMDGNAYHAQYDLDTIKVEYAGRWLKLAMRGISDSNISSWWSDEDEAADRTLNYRWLRLPRVQVETPEWTDASRDVYYEGEGDTWNVDWSNTSQIHVNQTSLGFPQTDFTDGYQICLVHSMEQTAENNYYVTEADWIYLVKDGVNYQVYYQSTDPDFDPQTEETSDPGESGRAGCFMSGDAVWIGTVGDGNRTLLLPRTALVRQTGTSEQTITIRSYLEWNEEGIVVVLPDALQVDYDGTIHTGSSTDTEFPNSYRNTAQAAVQGMLDQDNAEFYEDSMISIWYRQLNNKEYESVTDTMEDYAPAPSVRYSTQDIKPGAREESAFEWTVTSDVGSRLVYRVEVMDEAGNVIFSGLESAWVYDDQNAYRNLLNLPGNQYARYSGSRVRISMSAVLAGKGVTKWTEPVEASLPELIEQKVEETEIKDTSGNFLGREFTWTHHVRAQNYFIILTGQDGQDYYLSTEDLKAGDYDALWEDAAGGFEWAPAGAGNESIRLRIGMTEDARQYSLRILKEAWAEENSVWSRLNTLSGGNVTVRNVSGGDTASDGNVTGGNATVRNVTGGNATGGNATGGNATGGNATGGNATGRNVTGGNVTSSNMTGFDKACQNPGDITDSGQAYTVSDGGLPTIPYTALSGLGQPQVQRLRIKAVSVFTGYEPVIY